MLSIMETSGFSGRRLRTLRHQRSLSVAELARAVEKTESAIYRLEAENRAQPRADTIEALARALDVSADELLGLEEPEPREADPGLVEVPLLGHVAAGSGAIADGHVEDVISTRLTDIPTSPDHVYWLRAEGDSMRDAGILDGSLVLIARGQDPGDGDIAVVLIDGEEAVIKRVYREQDGICLVSANNDYRPIHVGGNVRIIGKVVLIETRLP